MRSDYRHFASIPTRWMDNDVYGHVNNVVFYSYFDTVINTYLIEQGGLDIAAGPVLGVCAESHCQFLSAITFPETIEAGLRVAHLGRTSVRYGVGLFQQGKTAAAAEGWFVHVFVDRVTRRPKEISAGLRSALERLQTEATT